MEHAAVGQAGQAVEVDLAQRAFDLLAVVHFGRQGIRLLLEQRDGAAQGVEVGVEVEMGEARGYRIAFTRCRR